MGQHILPGNPPVALILRRSPRARQISLRVSRLDGRVTLTVPQGVPEATALNFAHDKESWLRKQLSAQTQMIQVAVGDDIPFAGDMRRIVAGTGRRISLTEDTLAVPGPGDSVATRLQAWLKSQARDRLAAASDRYAAALGRPYTRLTLRDTRSRWGSCSSQGGLMYSWRLIMAAPEVLDYVAAHEVAHLAQMNHSPAFWAVVAQLYPDYERPRQWLRRYGTDLHRYRFNT
ncbi:M48 family metallopeptidase [Roseovarius gahaiensis]|uniref:M48 family metallopeptidase n=1 Tax=Roseovarius gahaiensis TaxID=2716691 RepID=A0A967BFH9_9RHOB|nr:SprT family zinc-dependent metalloprotease [Roseovarius gahaiensis]NHQ73633.1 M48 family metallopeptidase [Roseovarius gahaiensis]